MKNIIRLFCIFFGLVFGILFVSCPADVQKEETKVEEEEKQEESVESKEALFGVIQEDGSELCGLTFKIKKADYDHFNLSIFSEASKEEIYNCINLNITSFTYPFVDIGSDYVCTVDFYFEEKEDKTTKIHVTTESINVKAKSGFGEDYLAVNTNPNIEIYKSGDVIISNIPKMEYKSGISNNNYCLVVNYMASSGTRLFLLNFDTSSVENNTLKTNIKKNLLKENVYKQDWSDKDAYISFYYEFDYNGFYYKQRLINSYQFNWPSKKVSKETSVPETTVTKVNVNQFFWGTWQCMADGIICKIDENNVYEYLNNTGTGDYRKYEVLSSTTKTLVTNNEKFGTFTKQSESVILRGSIPYFRKGGSNLKYTLKLVGFEDYVTRAAGTISSLGGKKAVAISDTYKSFKSEAESDDDGIIRGLCAPVAGDVQTVKILENTEPIVVVTGLKIENSGSSMGTIPLSKGGQYSLKVTGTISENEKHEGYLYGNNYKSYPMTLTITNISEVESATSAISISPKDPALTLKSTDGSNLNLIMVSTLKPGMTKTVKMDVECGAIDSAYIDTGINITITNLETRKNWIDFVPIRFHRGLVPITVAGRSTEENTKAKLNGFIIYPDGNNTYFSIPHNGDKTVFVPSFHSTQNFLLVFSGAKVEGSLVKSTEMFYTVNPKTTEKKEIVIPENIDEAMNCYSFGEPNDSETNAFEIAGSVSAYLKDSDIDFYKINAASEEIYLPNGVQLYKVRYNNQKGNNPQNLSVYENHKLTKSELPELDNVDGYYFDGWYIGGEKISDGYTVNCNITLEARWISVE